jgi:hypothetical protein
MSTKTPKNQRAAERKVIAREIREHKAALRAVNQAFAKKERELLAIIKRAQADQKKLIKACERENLLYARRIAILEGRLA